MAHFALINDDNVVQEVIVISNDDVDNVPFPQSESIGQQYIASIGLTGTWLQTSYNANYRGIYAGIGDIYDPESDTFTNG